MFSFIYRGRRITQIAVPTDITTRKALSRGLAISGLQVCSITLFTIYTLGSRWFELLRLTVR